MLNLNCHFSCSYLLHSKCAISVATTQAARHSAGLTTSACNCRYLALPCSCGQWRGLCDATCGAPRASCPPWPGSRPTSSPCGMSSRSCSPPSQSTCSERGCDAPSSSNHPEPSEMSGRQFMFQCERLTCRLWGKTRQDVCLCSTLQTHKSQKQRHHSASPRQELLCFCCSYSHSDCILKLFSASLVSRIKVSVQCPMLSVRMF